MLEQVLIEKLVYGGQGIGRLADGRRVFVWNALPGEKLAVRLTKTKRDYAEGIAETVLEASPDRTEPRDEAYLSTSPWQIMEFEAENKHKQQILKEIISREKLAYDGDMHLLAKEEAWHYRSKMEYSFWGDEDGLHLALFYRGTHGKRIVKGSSIARPEIDETANKICSILGREGIRGSQLKTVIVRSNQQGETVAALFVKDEFFPDISNLQTTAKGLVVYFSNPKSPASVRTKQLYLYGDTKLTDEILGASIVYDVDSFFQVNLPVFEMALKQINYFTSGFKSKVDFYSGVGAIGFPVGATTLVESDPHNIDMAKQNAGQRPVKIVEAAAETALDYIPSDSALIVDPPRAGLHAKVIDRIMDKKPPLIAYLSCNPSTQARDLALLQPVYKIKITEGYNFFPRTPHIESLAILERA